MASIMRPAPFPSLRRALALTMVAALAALLATIPGPARADGDLPDRDYATVPKNCFAPGQEIRTPGPCYLTKYQGKRPTLILWGDSHAWQFIPALRQAVKGQKVNLISFASGSCPPAVVPAPPKGERYPGKCELNDALALKFIKKQRNQDKRFKVVLASNWGGFRQGYAKMMMDEVYPTSGYTDFVKQMIRLSHEGTPKLFTQLGRMGIDTDVIAQAATVPTAIGTCEAGQDPYLCDIPRWRAIPEERDTANFLKRQMSKLKNNPRYIDSTPSYCDVEVCHGQVGTIQTFYDNLHLSATRTRNLRQYFGPSVNDLQRGR